MPAAGRIGFRVHFLQRMGAPTAGAVGAGAVTAGLAAVGVDESNAFAIALTHRFCTYYLPPIWGSLALRWLGREGYV